MNVAERIVKLRALMAQAGMDAYVVPSADNHQSEYVGEHFKCRRFITGFTGSAGTAVFTQKKAGLWTDGRYFEQAEHQLAGSGVELYRMREPGVPTVEEFLAAELPENGVLGFDGRVLSVEEGKDFESALSYKNIRFAFDEDLVGKIWTDRPPLSEEPAFLLAEKYTGESSSHKLARVREEMRQVGATVHVLASLDDVSWLINLRGNDIEYSPLLLSYALIYMDKALLFIDERKLNAECRAYVTESGFTLRPYDDIYTEITHLAKQETILLDPMKLNFALYKSIPDNVRKVEHPNPTILMKAMKNQVELSNIREAHIKDGVAVTRYMRWVKQHAGEDTLTELSACDQLTAFRKEQDGYYWDSFEPICAYGDHAAMMHYTSTPETDVVLKPGGLFLNDTGGNYNEGSTDITRTFAIGSISQELKVHFTTVLRAMMRLASANFLYGCTGYNLDILARGPVWDLGIDFRCGTGHGVGYMLSIHEPPTGFRWYVVPAKNETHQLEDGMVLTDEPGIYVEGSHGIRLENELLVQKGEANEYGQFMHFETLTFVPFDLDAIDPALLNENERAWLNNYHRTVYNKLAPRMTADEREWLAKYTRAI